MHHQVRRSHLEDIGSKLWRENIWLPNFSLQKQLMRSKMFFTAIIFGWNVPTLVSPFLISEFSFCIRYHQHLLWHLHHPRHPHHCLHSVDMLWNKLSSIWRWENFLRRHFGCSLTPSMRTIKLTVGIFYHPNYVIHLLSHEWSSWCTLSSSTAIKRCFFIIIKLTVFQFLNGFHQLMATILEPLFHSTRVNAMNTSYRMRLIFIHICIHTQQT